MQLCCLRVQQRACCAQPVRVRRAACALAAGVVFAVRGRCPPSPPTASSRCVRARWARQRPVSCSRVAVRLLRCSPRVCAACRRRLVVAAFARSSECSCAFAGFPDHSGAVGGIEPTASMEGDSVYVLRSLRSCGGDLRARSPDASYGTDVDCDACACYRGEPTDWRPIMQER